MSEKLLHQLNPKATFESPGTEIVVPNVQCEEPPRKIARVEVSASEQRVRAYDRVHHIVAVYPATWGSSERPSPQGARHACDAVDFESRLAARRAACHVNASGITGPFLLEPGI
jgi:hypothetical protein